MVIPGTGSYGRVIAGLATQLLAGRDERDSIVEQLLAHPGSVKVNWLRRHTTGPSGAG